MDAMNFTAPRSESYVDWSEAYTRVESYYLSLRIVDKLLLSQLIAKVLSRAAERIEKEPDSSPASLAVEEAQGEVRKWFREVLEASGVATERIGTKGRLALFLTDMPRSWQREFLHAGPWPSEFLEAVKESYLHTGPGFQKSRMTPREIDLGTVSLLADETWKAIDRWPLLGTAFVWGLYLSVLAIIFYLTH